MPYSIVNGTAHVVASNKLNISETLGGNVYLVQFNQMTNQFELNQQSSFILPKKVYGHNTSITTKIMDLFERNVGRTSGVMLEGTKGTGKTLTAAEVCIQANSFGIPVIILQSPYSGEKFNDFMNSITEKCVVFIDEFEKTFKEQDDIDSVLQLLDGGIKTHKLFLMTSNTQLANNEKLQFLFNRPGRVHYLFTYGSLSNEIVQEYIDDCLQYKEYEASIKNLKRSFKVFTMDILKTIVNEVNFYGASKLPFNEIINDLNVKTDRGIESYGYKLSIVLDGVEVPESHLTFDSKKANSVLLSETIEDLEYYFLKFGLDKVDDVFNSELKPYVFCLDNYSTDSSLFYNTALYSKDELKEATIVTLKLDQNNWSQNEKTRALINTLNERISVVFTPILHEAKTEPTFYI